MTRVRAAAIGFLAVVGLLIAGCNETGTPVGSPSTVTVKVTAPASSSAASECATPPAILSGGVFAEVNSDSFAHVDRSPVAMNYNPCGKGLSYAVVSGDNGTREAPAGTGASAFESLVVFVDGRPTPAIPALLMHKITVTSANANEIVAVYDARHNGTYAPEETTVTIRHDGVNVTSSPSLTDSYGDRRASIDVAAASGRTSEAVAGPRGDGSSYTLRPASDFLSASSGAPYSFASPSRGINCFVGTANLVCETRQPVVISEAQTCGIPGYQPYETSRAKLFGWLDYDKPACGTLLQGQRRDAGTVLDYGQAVSFQPRPDLTIICYSRQAGVVCENPEGYGFSLAREGFDFYRV
ncbi:hypothetical protein [Gordonia sp. OPL2]|uniref:hypothetical protein n=1 Tax=Gordonia sp. OPL2 TaxID=2486274 RepID=UPI0016566806|nr:hypothetical protein [Gordonia sp. OPL2]ROZ98782.1 hypothetical protein EEB19_14125 [Gordonia sp. OPL2]